MSLYKAYKTDKKLETEGVTFELYGNRVTLARAGSSNTDFVAALTKRTQPYRRQIQKGEMLPEKDNEIMRLVFADTIIQNWEVEVDGEWKQGIEGPDGSLMPFTHANVVKTLTDLPDLFGELQTLATQAQNYRAEELKADAGN